MTAHASRSNQFLVNQGPVLLLSLKSLVGAVIFMENRSKFGRNRSKIGAIKSEGGRSLDP
jgi:hypothetical protein